MISLVAAPAIVRAGSLMIEIHAETVEMTQLYMTLEPNHG